MGFVLFISAYVILTAAMFGISLRDIIWGRGHPGRNIITLTLSLLYINMCMIQIYERG